MQFEYVVSVTSAADGWSGWGPQWGNGCEGTNFLVIFEADVDTYSEVPTVGCAPVVCEDCNTVTFSVNTANITVGANGMYVGGGVLGNAQAHQMSDSDGDGIWTVDVELAAGTSGNYAFFNSPGWAEDWNTKENLTDLPCADPGNWWDRILPEINGDTTLLHCFGTCDSDGTCPTPATFVTVNFEIDMNYVDYPNADYDQCCY
jgi:hypothetical protein